jgi:hypothetical protein
MYHWRQKMNKLLVALLAAVSLNAVADNELSYMPNKLGGSIFFTYSQCVYVNTGAEIPHNFYVYSTDKYGNKILDGCYEYKYPFYLVRWNTGARLSVNINQVNLLK